jgi:hypothetical protein
MSKKIYVGGELVSATDATDLLVSLTDDTGTPWEIPYIDGGGEGSLAAFSEDLADAVAAGLDAAGAIKQFKFATDSTLRFTNSTSFVDGSISLSFTPTAADSLLCIEWTGQMRAVRNTDSIISRMGVFRLVEVSGSPLVGAESVQVGRSLVSSNNSGAPTRDAVSLRSVLVAGSTNARTYRLEFASNSATLGIDIANDDSTGILSVTEYGSGVL